MYSGRAEVLREGAERDRLWDQHVEALPHFAAYPEQTRARDPDGPDRQDQQAEAPDSSSIVKVPLTAVLDCAQRGVGARVRAMSVSVSGATGEDRDGGAGHREFGGGPPRGREPSDERAVVEALARAVVEDAAPRKGRLFGPMTEAYYDPRRGTPGGSKSEQYGVRRGCCRRGCARHTHRARGGEEAFGYLVGELQAAFKDEAEPMIQALVKRVLRRGPKPEGGTAAAETPPTPQLTQAQLDNSSRWPCRPPSKSAFETRGVGAGGRDRGGDGSDWSAAQRPGCGRYG